MSLELENKFLLLIERAPKGTQNFCFKKEKPNKNSRSVGSNSKTKNNDLKTSINTITRPNNDSDLLIYEKEELPHIEKSNSIWKNFSSQIHKVRKLIIILKQVYYIFDNYCKKVYYRSKNIKRDDGIYTNQSLNIEKSKKSI